MLYFGMEFKLEICVDNVESAIDAQNAGADRIELCSDLPEGGTTPGPGTIISARKNLNIGLHVIIRPRGGDFLYSGIDFDIMRRDIEICGEYGVDGVVLGILLPDGSIDTDRTAMLIELARPMTVTFHRAFDMCKDPFRGLKDIIGCGADRLLTSGHKDKAEDGIELIKSLREIADNKIIIMPGSGINDLNISKIASGTGAREFHLTGRKTINSDMIYHKQDISMGGLPGVPEFTRKVADKDMIRSIINNLKMI
jgi:copper homeostasis protein